MQSGDGNFVNYENCSPRFACDSRNEILEGSFSPPEKVGKKTQQICMHNRMTGQRGWFSLDCHIVVEWLDKKKVSCPSPISQGARALCNTSRRSAFGAEISMGKVARGQSRFGDFSRHAFLIHTQRVERMTLRWQPNNGQLSTDSYVGQFQRLFELVKTIHKNCGRLKAATVGLIIARLIQRN
jgi:hypothetical protein